MLWGILQKLPRVADGNRFHCLNHWWRRWLSLFFPLFLSTLSWFRFFLPLSSFFPPPSSEPLSWLSFRNVFICGSHWKANESGERETWNDVTIRIKLPRNDHGPKKNLINCFIRKWNFIVGWSAGAVSFESGTTFPEIAADSFFRWLKPQASGRWTMKCTWIWAAFRSLLLVRVIIKRANTIVKMVNTLNLNRTVPLKRLQWGSIADRRDAQKNGQNAVVRSQYRADRYPIVLRDVGRPCLLTLVRFVYLTALAYLMSRTVVALSISGQIFGCRFIGFGPGIDTISCSRRFMGLLR